MFNLSSFNFNDCSARFKLVEYAYKAIYESVISGYYDYDDLEHGRINYTEICEWCDFPDFQDGGIFEQSIDIAAEAVRKIMGGKWWD